MGAGDLLPEEYSAIVDMHARRRLNLLMDIMCRMELLKGLLISENSHISRLERSVYIVRPDVSFEEPRRVSEPGFVSRPFNQDPHTQRLWTCRAVEDQH